MGLLDDLQDRGFLRGLLAPAQNPVGRWAQGVAQRTIHPLETLAAEAQRVQSMPIDQLTNEVAGNLNGGVGGLLGATAWHGSPHLFDKFKTEAIGTGEGAQAYGHGLYLAESPKVAQSYKENLSKNKVAINGQPINNAAPDELAAAVLVQSKGNKNAALQFLQSNLQYAKGDSVKKLNNAINYLKSGQELPVAEIAGSLYKTDIPNAHIDKMLDWDKPLSEQHPDVRAALSGLNLPDKPWNTGSKIYESLSGKTGFKNAQEQQQYATAKLQELGIPGIKYLDGSSRTAGEGTRNFVIFDPEHIRILERNGQPTGQQPWDLGQ